MTNRQRRHSQGTAKHQPRKRFGQHFLTDNYIIEQIIAAINPQPDDTCVEIGPGLGALTIPLLKRLNRLQVIELDRDIIPRLALLPEAADKLQIHQADALNFDFAALASSASLRVIGNLPYNISTPLIFHLLGFRARIADMHFMLQREVVLRLAAAPNCKDYGRLSVMTQFYCAVTPLFDVPPAAFSPPPKVDSAVVRLRPYAAAPVDVGDVGIFEKLLKQAFSQRRKTLRNNLQTMLTAAQISSSGIDPGARAETLSLQEFATLSKNYNGLLNATE